MTLEIQGNNLTLKGKNTALRRITSYAGKPGTNVRLEGLQFINPGWDGMYVRGITGLTLKNCVFDRPYRNGISVIDTVDMLAEDCTFSNSLPNGTGRVSPMVRSYESNIFSINPIIMIPLWTEFGLSSRRLVWIWSRTARPTGCITSRSGGACP